ncbi:hypothetical protein [uncultured Lutibacter sp.]|uniref:hypothetical protein n=1 Tax=uncultured Lutibacter sp. TaxID=437739 RepID=UPI00261B80D0|nr:hypothetical protein [uncultured Lutibacter sp.]
METSILIARIIGVIYLSFGIGLLINSAYYKKKLIALIDSAVFSILGGMMAIIIGFLIIHNHNYWEPNWTIVITIIGWIALTKGVLLLLIPKFTKAFKPIFQFELFYVVLIPLIIGFGLVFCYFGFLS